jgi:hypothetical protein
MSDSLVYTSSRISPSLQQQLNGTVTPPPLLTAMPLVVTVAAAPPASTATATATATPPLKQQGRRPSAETRIRQQYADPWVEFYNNTMSKLDSAYKPGDFVLQTVDTFFQVDLRRDRATIWMVRDIFAISGRSRKPRKPTNEQYTWLQVYGKHLLAASTCMAKPVCYSYTERHPYAMETMADYAQTMHDIVSNAYNKRTRGQSGTGDEDEEDANDPKKMKIATGVSPAPASPPASLPPPPPPPSQVGEVRVESFAEKHKRIHGEKTANLQRVSAEVVHCGYIIKELTLRCQDIAGRLKSCTIREEKLREEIAQMDKVWTEMETMYKSMIKTEQQSQ